MTKYLKYFLIALVFLPLFSMQGVDMRLSQEIFFRLFVMSLLMLVLDNIWISAFLGLTLFSFLFFKCQVGYNYVTNVFLGSLLYFLVKVAFKKEDTEKYINAFLWLVVLNIFYMACQKLNFDFYYFMIYNGTNLTANNTDPCGFMGLKAMTAVLMACSVPILLSRWNLTSKIASGLMIIPLYITTTSSAILGAVVGVMFVLWYKITRKWIWVIMLVVLLMGGIGYVALVDAPMGMMPTRINMWKGVLHDATIRPLTGWGMDSFRNVTGWKPNIYLLENQTPNGPTYDKWDNPHNLYVSLFFEWGILGWVILIGLLRQYTLWFNRAIKSSITIGLAGFILALLVINIGQFPLFLARGACWIIPLCALYERQVKS